MARGGGFDAMTVVKWGAILGGGYWLFSKVSAGSTSGAPFSLSDLWASITGAAPAGTPAPPAAGSGAPPASAPPAGTGGGTAPPSGAPPVTLAQRLLQAAQGDPALVDGKMDADHWNYYRNLLFPPALTGDQFVQAFPYVVSGDRTKKMTPDAFVAALHTAGLAGYGRGMGSLPARAQVVQLRDGRRGVVWVRT